MRKYIVGALFGFLIALTVSAHAEVVNMIGKVVDGMFDVTVNGAKLDTQAIVIEGTSYLPVRSIGNAIGLKVGFNANTGVILDSPSTSIQDQLNALGKEANNLFEQRLLLVNSSIAPYETPSGKDENGRDIYKPKDDAYYAAKKKVEEMTAELNDISKQIEDLTKQK